MIILAGRNDEKGHEMTREDRCVIDAINTMGLFRTCYSSERIERVVNKAICNLEAITALGDELRTVRGGIKGEALIGYNIAVAICNKHLGEVENAQVHG